jgi:transcriptional regulator with XRE-family HTH domain
MADVHGMKPRSVIVYYRGLPYEVDLHPCRRALVRRQVEGEIATMTDLAMAAGMSRSTATRFFAGRNLSLNRTLAILAALRLEFDTVAKPVEADEAACWAGDRGR